MVQLKIIQTTSPNTYVYYIISTLIDYIIFNQWYTILKILIRNFIYLHQ